jgi:hypothetical protein
MMVVVKDGKIEYITRNASTLPDNPKKHAVVQDGVYRYGSGTHSPNKSNYAALRLLDPDGTVDQGNEPMPVYRDGVRDTGTAFNIHAGDTDAGPTYSEGCQIVLVDDYIDFGQAVGFVDSTYNQSEYDEYSDLKGNVSVVQGVNITYVLDRAFMSEEKKGKFGLP